MQRPKKASEEKLPPPPELKMVKKQTNLKPQDPLFKIKFILNKEAEIKEKIEAFNEDDTPNLDEFDLNYWDGGKIRRFPHSEKMIETAPKEEDLTDIIASFFKESGIERGIKNWRNTLDIYIDSLEEWDDVVGGRVRDR